MSLDAGNNRSVPDVSNATFANLRRAKSLDRRVTESSMTVSACSVIAIHVGYFWYVHDVMHHSFMLHTQYYISVCCPQSFIPLYWSFLMDLSASVAGVIHSVCGWSLGQTAAASKPHPLRVADTRSCTHQCRCRHR